MKAFHESLCHIFVPLEHLGTVDSSEAAAYGLRSTASFLLKLKADPNATNFKVRLLVEIWRRLHEEKPFIPPTAKQSPVIAFIIY